MRIGRVTAVSELEGWLRAVAQISAAVNTNQPLGNVLNAVAETTCRLLDYDFSAVLLVDEAHARLVIQSAHGLSESYIASVNTDPHFQLGPGPDDAEVPSARAFRSLKPVVMKDAQLDPDFSHWAKVAVAQGYRSLAAIPLIVSGEAIGTLTSYTRTVHDFSPEELLLLETMANHAASAIAAARLREQEEATILRLEEAFRALEAQARFLERSEEIHCELTNVVLQDSGLAAIATALARILSGSVVIADPAGTELAAASFGAIPASLTEFVGDPAALVVRLGEPREAVDLRAADDPAISGRVFIAPVAIGREVGARLWVLQPAGEFGALERRALEHGATVVALELLKQRIASAAESRFETELLYDLIDSKRLPDRRTLSARASRLHFDLAARHAAIVVKADHAIDGDPRGSIDESVNRRLLAIVKLTLRKLRVLALAGERDGGVVILVSEASAAGTRGVADVAEAIRRDARRGLSGAPVSAAVGPWVDRIEDAPRSFQIARGAIEIAWRAGNSDLLVKLDDLGVYGLLLTVGDLGELVGFADKTLSPIRTYDKRRGSDLLTTLRAYLECSCRTADAAAALDVHPNTVAYRIHRIETILGIDLTQPESLLRVQLALVLDGVANSKASASVEPKTDI